VLGGRPAGMPCLDKVGDAHPKIERIAMTHDPPPVPGGESQLGLAQKPRNPFFSPML
jgi:hypothetical protein